MKICSMSNCDRKVNALNLCKNHYVRRWKRGPDADISVELKRGIKANPEKNKHRHMLTPTEARAFREDAGRCAICGGPPEVVDHDHTTRATRDALCRLCNLALGRVEQQGGAAWARLAADYLDRWSVK